MSAASAVRRDRRGRKYDPAKRRSWNYRTRYGVSAADVDALLASQGGLCAICRKVPRRPVVDHDHSTGKVRGVLCHACNVMAGSLENDEFRRRALAYLGLEVA